MKLYCTLSDALCPQEIYVIVPKKMTIPPAIFICKHCAEKWADEYLYDNYEILTLDKSINFLFDSQKLLTDITIIDNTNSDATL